MSHSIGQTVHSEAQGRGVAWDVRRGDGPAERFERLYRMHVRAVMGYFARRSREPQAVFDLTADTFVEAIRSFSPSTPAAGHERGWLFAIARRVYAQHCEATARRERAELREGAQQLGEQQLEELLERIDAEREGRHLLRRLAQLPTLEREAVELVDIAGLAPKEAAASLGVSPGTLRVRLFRARARLRKEQTDDEQS